MFDTPAGGIVVLKAVLMVRMNWFAIRAYPSVHGLTSSWARVIALVDGRE